MHGPFNHSAPFDPLVQATARKWVAAAVMFAAGSLAALGSCTDDVTPTSSSSAPARPTQLIVTTQPSSTAQSSVPFPQQPVVQLGDAAGNDVAQSGVLVTASIASGGGVLGGTTTVSTDASGRAVFTNLMISGTPGNRTLRFTAPGLTATTSNTVALTPRIIQFAGRNWEVKVGFGGPGPNNWSDTDQSVWVDADGRLHLRLREVGGVWYAAEVRTVLPTKYGMHRFYLIGPVDQLDRNVIFSAFVYGDDSKEIDIEFSN
jgi:hypothetical protein